MTQRSFLFKGPMSYNFVSGPMSYNFHQLKGKGSRPSYKYPSLYQEADDMTNLSVLVYTLADIRQLARSGKIKDSSKSSRLLDLPLPMSVAFRIVVEERELLKEKLGDGTHDATLNALTSTVDRYNAMVEERKALVKQGRSLASIFDFFCCENSAASSGTTPDPDCPMLVAVGDEKPEQELVYVVVINPFEKRITVGFRGSATTNDFATDAKIGLVRVADPRKGSIPGALNNSGSGSVEETENSIGIHQGFHDYLFGAKENKYEKIMSIVNGLLDVGDRRETFRVYVTGHSLGGALATLFGFYAAASSSSKSLSSSVVPLPVTVVSVASPRVGNEAFAKAFASLESAGNIRHLRIANHRDPVTLGPTVSSKRALTNAARALSPLGYLAIKLSGNEAGKGETYVHTGMKMKLRKKVEQGESVVGSGTQIALCEFSYSGAKFVKRESTGINDSERSLLGGQKESSSAGPAKSNFDGEVPLASYHFGMAYTERLANVRQEVAGLTLNDLYRDHTLA